MDEKLWQKLLSWLFPRAGRELRFVSRVPKIFAKWGLICLVAAILAGLVTGALLWSGVTSYFVLRADRFKAENEDLTSEIVGLRDYKSRAEPLIAELEDLKSRTQVKVDRVDQFMPYIQHGNALASMEIKTDDEFYAWLKVLGHWERSVMTLLNLFSPPTATKFDRATKTGSWKGYKDRHGTERAYLSSRLDTLSEYVQALEREKERQERQDIREKANNGNR